MISKPITSPTQSFETKVEPTLDNEAVMPYLKSETVQEIQEPLNDLDEELNMESIMKEEQATFNFENTQPLELKKETPKPLPVVMEELKKEEKIIHYLEDDLEEESPVNEIAKTPETTTVERVSKEEQQQINEGRRERIQELSMKLRTPFGLSELENEPAYIRRKIKLEDTPHSSESEVSRFTLSEEEGQDGKTSGSIKSNNSFLHDNVD
jgi:cell division protein FtsZ